MHIHVYSLVRFIIHLIGLVDCGFLITLNQRDLLWSQLLLSLSLSAVSWLDRNARYHSEDAIIIPSTYWYSAIHLCIDKQVTHAHTYLRYRHSTLIHPHTAYSVTYAHTHYFKALPLRCQFKQTLNASSLISSSHQFHLITNFRREQASTQKGETVCRAERCNVSVTN